MKHCMVCLIGLTLILAACGIDGLPIQPGAPATDLADLADLADEDSGAR